MPTLYTANDDSGTGGFGGYHRKPKLSLIELLLYNSASMLASVGSGYDVRMSNVSPIHPNLRAQILNDQQQLLNRDQPTIGIDNDCDDRDHDGSNINDPININHMNYSLDIGDNNEYSLINDRNSFPHNTYHGPVRHSR